MHIKMGAAVCAAIACLLTACGRPSPSTPVATIPSPATTVTSGVVLPATPSETPLPPSPQPTVVPIEGITATELNVRAEPSTASGVLGILPSNTRVEITGKDPGESWWQINYPSGPGGKGWITAEYVNTTATPAVPVIGAPEETPTNGTVAIIQQQLNVRSGPGTGFNSLGTLNPQDVVRLTGKDANGAWLQIEFPAGPEGRGWVNAAFVRTEGVENLPIVSEAGQVVGTGTPTTIPPTPTPTLVPAPEDRDSASAPLASVVFEPTGTQTLLYNGDVSSPQGDAEDWIAFQPYRQFVFLQMTCQGQGALSVELLENAQSTAHRFECSGSTQRVPVDPGANYLLHVQAAPSNTLQYTNYTLVVRMMP